MTNAIAELPGATELADLFAQPRREPAPEPGVYFGIPMETYLLWDALSSSQLGEMIRSPAHARVFMEPAPAVDNDDTLATIIGTAAHCAVLEPHEFHKRYLRGPLGNWTNKGPKDAVKALREANPRCSVLKPYKYDAVLKARDAILAHPAAWRLLDEATCMEVSITWDDAETGLRCKARPDFLIPDWGTIGDLKSTQDARPSGFARDIAKYRYHGKAAWYLDGMNATRAFPPNAAVYDQFAFIAFEKEEPFALAVYQLEPFDIEIGRTQNRALIRRWAECELRQEWPAYSQDIEPISLPEWAQV